MGDPPNGAPVAIWGDVAQGNDATQGIADNQPTVVANAINGRTAIRFDGDDAVRMPSVLGQTVFAVVRVDPATSLLDGLMGQMCCDRGFDGAAAPSGGIPAMPAISPIRRAA
ncbi:MAG: hypothetical protein AAF492_25985, partial [Verrucomicrobiota bacterium]